MFDAMPYRRLHSQFLHMDFDSELYDYRGEITLAECDGIKFVCPKCADKDGHQIILWKPHVPITAKWEGPGRWEMVGSGVDDITLVAGTSSVQLLTGCQAHFFINGGVVTPA